MARRAAAAKTSVRVNFKDVESRRTPPEADYILEILEANSGDSSKGNAQIEFVLEIAKGEYKGTKLWFYCPLDEKSLWKLHAFLTALGEDVPQDDFDIDLPELIGKQVVGVLTHETFQGRKRARMTDFDSVENYSGKDTEDKSDGKKSKKDKKADKGISDKELIKELKKSKKDKASKVKKYDADDIKGMTDKELKKLIKEHDLDVDLADFKTLKKQAAAVIDALETKDLIED